MARTDFKSVKEYIASKPKDVRVVLEQVRRIIRKAIPAAEEVISYQIPAYRLNGRRALYFAGWKEHFSLYPLNDALVAAFKDELSSYKLSKGTVRFPLSEPVPVRLIERIAKFRAKQTLTGGKTKSSGRKGGESQLERIRRICARIPAVFEKVSHGVPSFFVQEHKGVFAMLVDNHHQDGRLALWLAAPPGLQSALIADAPATYFKPPYVGVGGWIGIELGQVRDEALEIHIREAWEIIAGKKKSKGMRAGLNES
jgi:uncharacterized protein YdhG (YjbR/CyaY superfamily)